ncbi:heme biosynthesis protein HemY, partial [Priestia megaterium]
MEVKINRNAAKVLKNALASPEGQGKMIRVY